MAGLPSIDDLERWCLVHLPSGWAFAARAEAEDGPGGRVVRRRVAVVTTEREAVADALRAGGWKYRSGAWEHAADPAVPRRGLDHPGRAPELAHVLSDVAAAGRALEDARHAVGRAIAEAERLGLAEAVARLLDASVAIDVPLAKLAALARDRRALEVSP